MAGIGGAVGWAGKVLAGSERSEVSCGGAGSVREGGHPKYRRILNGACNGCRGGLRSNHLGLGVIVSVQHGVNIFGNFLDQICQWAARFEVL